MKDHLKTLAAPRTWPIKRKGLIWIKRPFPGKHKFEHGMSLDTIVKTILKLAKTSKEVKYIINNKTILIDNKKATSSKTIVGLMDTISFPEIKEFFRVIINTKGKLEIVKIDEKESLIKVCKISGKKLHKGKTQISTNDGRTILTDMKDLKVNDSIIISLPDQKITEHIKFEKGNLAYLISGKHIGDTGIIQDIKDNSIIIKSKDSLFETDKKCIFIIGKDKPMVNIK